MQWHVFEETADAAVGSDTLQWSSLCQVLSQRGRIAPVSKFFYTKQTRASQRKKDNGRKRKQLSYLWISTYVCLPEKLLGCTLCSHHSVFFFHKQFKVNQGIDEEKTINTSNQKYKPRGSVLWEKLVGISYRNALVYIFMNSCAAKRYTEHFLDDWKQLTILLHLT